MFHSMFGRAALLLCLLGMSAHAAVNPPAPNGPPPPLNRTQALQALENPSPQQRLAAVLRLADVGTMADADRLVSLLRDADEQVRQMTGAALWQIWGRSGDKGIDAMYQQGLQQMEASKLTEAVATFTAIIAKRPAFAEAWNKRATVYYVMGLLDLSLKDCDEVIKRNPNHFGALSGYAQIYLQKGDLGQAITYLERALKVNPNLDGVPEAIEQLRQQLDQKRGKMI